ncbi:MAG: hypothetical protein IJ463_01525 [Bacilli bacterium]|nr:hypothetical protein [Bacilli bacterium]
MAKKTKKEIIEWYDNPNFISNLMIVLIFSIIICSQSFAIGDNNSLQLFGSIINHNTVYILVLIYFLSLKTTIGKKYFNYLNLFVIFIYLVNTITSFLTVIQDFSLSTVLSFSIVFVLFIYIIHTFLRDTRLWKDFNMTDSPFNELTNDWYFYTLIVLSTGLLIVKLISTLLFSGVILSIFDCLYIVILGRYIYLYRDYLDDKNKDSNNSGNFDEIKDLVKDTIDDAATQIKKAIDVDNKKVKEGDE